MFYLLSFLGSFEALWSPYGEHGGDLGQAISSGLSSLYPFVHDGRHCNSADAPSSRFRDMYLTDIIPFVFLES